MLESRPISSAYRKLHTAWQHAAAFTGGMSFSAPPTAAARRRAPRVVLATALVVVIAAVIAILAYPTLTDTASVATDTTSGAASPMTAAPPAPRLDDPVRSSPPGHAQRDRHHELGVSGGKVPTGVTVFDVQYPAVAKLDPNLLAALRQAATDAADQHVEFFVISGWRSPDYQEQLLDEAVAKYGSRAEAARWVATPTTSPHVTGDAVDIGKTAATRWLSAHGAGYGLCQIYRNEPWHFELRSKAVRHGCPPMYADPTEDPRMKR